MESKAFFLLFFLYVLFSYLEIIGLF